MAKSPYTKFADNELILRDYLALDRTVLANERTFLAYVRTSFAFVVGGISLIHFFESAPIHFVGRLLFGLGIISVAIGTVSFYRTKRRLDELERKHKKDS